MYIKIIVISFCSCELIDRNIRTVNEYLLQVLFLHVGIINTIVIFDTKSHCLYLPSIEFRVWLSGVKKHSLSLGLIHPGDLEETG